MKRNEFIEYVIGDQLAHVPAMSAKAMFSGFGIYREGTIVGIAIDDELYLKADETNEAKYRLMGSTPFSYDRKGGKRVSMSYWKVPPDVLEDRERLAELVEEAYEINLAKAAKAGQKTKRARKKKSPA